MTVENSVKTVAAVTNGRTARGRFAHGNGHGCGRPAAVVQRERLDALLSTVTDKEWTSICKTAVAAAVNGDRHAREWVSRYLLPRVDDVPRDGRIQPIEIVTTPYSYDAAVAAIAWREGD